MEVFSAVRLGVKPEINAVASLILLAVSLVTFLVWFFSRRAEEARKRAIQQAIEESAADSWKQPDVRRAHRHRKRLESDGLITSCGQPQSHVGAALLAMVGQQR